MTVFVGSCQVCFWPHSDMCFGGIIFTCFTQEGWLTTISWQVRDVSAMVSIAPVGVSFHCTVQFSKIPIIFCSKHKTEWYLSTHEAEK